MVIYDMIFQTDSLDFLTQLIFIKLADIFIVKPPKTCTLKYN